MKLRLARKILRHRSQWPRLKLQTRRRAGRTVARTLPRVLRYAFRTTLASGTSAIEEHRRVSAHLMAETARPLAMPVAVAGVFCSESDFSSQRITAW